MPLTDSACRNAKPKPDVYKLADGAGLCLRIVPAGGKYWIFRYRHEGKQKDLSLGVYPALALADARAMRDDAKRSLKEGVDPSIVKIMRRTDLAVKGESLKELGEAWLSKMKQEWDADFTAIVKKRLENYIYPTLGKLPAAAVTPPQILGALKKIEKAGFLETMHRVKNYVDRIFKFGIACGKLNINPAANLDDALPAAKGKNYAAIEPGDIPALLKKLSDEKVGIGFQTRLAMRFLMLTFVRTGEMIKATWDEIDLEKQIWLIPAVRMKMKRDHIVPLSRQAISILKTLRMLSASKWVFPSQYGWQKPMCNMTILMGLQRMGYKGRMTGHGFRALAMTTLREDLDYPFDVIDLQLAHAPRSKVKAAYDRAKFIKERTRMMQDWADYIDVVEFGAK